MTCHELRSPAALRFSSLVQFGFKHLIARIILAAGIPGIMGEWAQEIAYQVVYNHPGSSPGLERAWARAAYRLAFPPANYSCFPPRTASYWRVNGGWSIQSLPF
jgi:hypothetical protein